MKKFQQKGVARSIHKCKLAKLLLLRADVCCKLTEGKLLLDKLLELKSSNGS